MNRKHFTVKKAIAALIILFVIGISLFILPKHILRYFYWNFADINDYKKFPSVEVRKSENPFTFIYPDHETDITLPEKFNVTGRDYSFDEFLEEYETVAFLILRQDTLIYENYFDGYTQESIIPSFSVSKVFVSALVGIAIDEGHISSTHAKLVDYLPELKKPGFDKITIEDLLNMRSGINYNEGYNSPFADMAKYYYGTDLKRYIRTLKVKEEPDQTYDYVSVNTLLLSLVLEKATNRKINEYLEQKIWQPIGMESDASWSIDSEENQTVKAFCCINAVARDYVKFGRLYLNDGNWQGNQIVSEQWVKRSTTIINDSRDSQGYPYTYHWRVLDNGAYFAKGILGQYIFVNPEKNLVFVRLGKDYADINWADLCVELSKAF